MTSKNIEKAFIKQATDLWNLVEAYFGDGFEQGKEAIAEKIKACSIDVDFAKMYDAVVANLDEPMNDSQRERYCFSLIIPYKCYSDKVYPKVLIDESKESIGKVQGADGMVKILEQQITGALEQEKKWFDMAYSAEALQSTDEIESTYRDLAWTIRGYAKMLDAAFAVHGIDLMAMQEKCGVFVMPYWYTKNDRITGLGEYVGSQKLAQEYLDRLPDEPQKKLQSSDSNSCLAVTPTEHRQAMLRQETKSKPTRGRGRPKMTFKDKMNDDVDGGKLQKMHAIMKGKKGKDASLIILAAIKKGWITRPTHKQVEDEFGDIGSKEGYNKYLNEKSFDKVEIEGAINSLE